MGLMSPLSPISRSRLPSPGERQLLEKLVACHGTPGDEAEVAAVLLQEWHAAGWATARHGPYAISARHPAASHRRHPTLLLCAHMDAPGFVVDQIGRATLGLVPLGAIQAADGETFATSLKTRTGRHPLTLRKLPAHAPGQRDRYVATLPATAAATTVTLGDRACFDTPPVFRPRDGHLAAPFLDNRLGCLLLTMLARELPATGRAWNVVLGATACEELGGFGAPVLAAASRPDLVLCLDATYEAPKMGVRLGRGPVLTVTDASVLLSPAVRDTLRDWAAARGLPLQLEAYNYSGTDSKAFPLHGLPAPVLPLLLPTRGNHTPREEARWCDLRALADLILAFVQSPPAALARP